MKVLVSDFDGTLLTTRKQLIQNNQAVQEFRKKGNLFIIATGRNFTSIMKEIKQISLEFDYLICNDGAMILNQNGTCLEISFLSSDCQKKIIELFSKFPYQMNWYFDDGFHYVKKEIKTANRVIIKFEDLGQAKQVLETVQKEIPQLDGYISRNWVNIMDKNINKSIAIHKLKELASIAEDDIYTIGDNANDQKMLEEYHGYVIETTNSQRLLNENIPSVTSVASLIEELMKKE